MLPAHYSLVNFTFPVICTVHVMVIPCQTAMNINMLFELVLFFLSSQRIDMERATREAMDPNLRHKPRLLSEEELPSWLIKDEDEVNKIVLILQLQLLVEEIIVFVVIWVHPSLIFSKSKEIYHIHIHIHVIIVLVDKDIHSRSRYTCS